MLIAPGDNGRRIRLDLSGRRFLKPIGPWTGPRSRLFTFILLGVKEPDDPGGSCWFWILRHWSIIDGSSPSLWAYSSMAGRRRSDVRAMPIKMDFEHPLTSLVMAHLDCFDHPTYFISYLIIPTLAALNDTSQWWKAGLR